MGREYVKTTTKKKKCTCCMEPKTLTDFYISYSPLHSLDKRIPVCKDCCKSLSVNDDGTINVEKLNNLLRNIDKPLYYDILFTSEKSVRSENNISSDKELKEYGISIVAKYFLSIQTPKCKFKSYAESEKDGFISPGCEYSFVEIQSMKNKYGVQIGDDSVNQFSSSIPIDDIPVKEIPERKNSNKPISTFDDKKFKVTQSMIDLFGDGYTPLEYMKMSKKYNEMSQTYVIQTSIHKEALVTYVRFKVKEEMATARGDVQEAQKWYSAAQSAAEQGKLTAKQISKEDLQGGIVNFSDIFKAVEGARERIRIFPEFKYQPKDAADFIIWCYINYERNLNNMPEVEYKDIYHFYDEKKKEYIEQYGDPYGIFTDDTTESNRDAIEKFITIPPEFREGG